MSLKMRKKSMTVKAYQLGAGDGNGNNHQRELKITALHVNSQAILLWNGFCLCVCVKR